MKKKQGDDQLVEATIELCHKNSINCFWELEVRPLQKVIFEIPAVQRDLNLQLKESS